VNLNKSLAGDLNQPTSFTTAQLFKSEKPNKAQNDPEAQNPIKPPKTQWVGLFKKTQVFLIRAASGTDVGSAASVLLVMQPKGNLKDVFRVTILKQLHAVISNCKSMKKKHFHSIKYSYHLVMHRLTFYLNCFFS